MKNSERLSEPITFNVTADERREILRRAAAANQILSDWIRDRLLDRK